MESYEEDISPCGRYCFRKSSKVNEVGDVVVFVLLNPRQNEYRKGEDSGCSVERKKYGSNAFRVAENIARELGAKELHCLYLFPFIVQRSDYLENKVNNLASDDNEAIITNNAALERFMNLADRVVVCCGNFGSKKGALKALVEIVRKHEKDNLYCFGYTDFGNPRYIKDNYREKFQPYVYSEPKKITGKWTGKVVGRITIGEKVAPNRYAIRCSCGTEKVVGISSVIRCSDRGGTGIRQRRILGA